MYQQKRNALYSAWEGKSDERITCGHVLKLLTRWLPGGQLDHCTSCWIFNVGGCTRSHPAACVALLKMNPWLFSFRLFLCVWPACSFALLGLKTSRSARWRFYFYFFPLMFHLMMDPALPPHTQKNKWINKYHHHGHILDYKDNKR